MKHSLVLKFIAVILTALALFTAAAGAAGIWLLESNDLYTHSLEDQQEEWYDNAGRYIAWEYACRYAAKHLGGCSDVLLNRLYAEDYYGMASDHWQIILYEDGSVISQTYQLITDPVYRDYTFTVEYPVAHALRNDEPQDGQEAPSDEPETPPLYTSRFTIWENGEMVEYRLNYYESPVYTIHVQMHPDITQGTPNAALSNVYPYRYGFIAILIGGLLLFAAGTVFLCVIAGKRKDGSILPGGLCKLPIDLYALICAGCIWLLTLLIVDFFRWSQQSGLTAGRLSAIGVSAYCIALLLTGFIFSAAAQAKLPNHYWWKHSLLRPCALGIWRFLCFCGRAVRTVFRLLPLIWQWLISSLLSSCAVFAASVVCLDYGFSRPYSGLFLALFVIALLVWLLIIFYGAYAFGMLLRGVENLNQGNLNYKISTKYLLGGFENFAQQLNTLSDTVMQSARHRLKAEQMKTELITNISHDIKTPLTSIINFVDLLQKPHTQEEQIQYLTILSKQSARMKKLIEDLVELSKASTGNLTVNLTRMDAGEAMNQALGEFYDRLELARITPVFHKTETPMYMLADGKLTWRVLSNLLSNVVKYATPDTRLYIDLIEDSHHVILSLKNISREPLKVSAEELLERFVQGDLSRNTEGSGLGLNIAQSLMIVQHGQLQLTIDGDLFKVTALFPKG